MFVGFGYSNASFCFISAGMWLIPSIYTSKICTSFSLSCTYPGLFTFCIPLVFSMLLMIFYRALPCFPTDYCAIHVYFYFSPFSRIFIHRSLQYLWCGFKSHRHALPFVYYIIELECCLMLIFFLNFNIVKPF